MAERRALLIDSDPEFHDLCARVLAPYAVAVHAVTDGSDGLKLVPELSPEVIIIAVELPDKIGYSICNKAKKGVARKIPVVLASATVPPSDLEHHRTLPKVRADEYIDKRIVTPEELVQKLDALINLGPPLEEGFVDAEDIHFDDDPVSAIAPRPEEVAEDGDSGPGFAESTAVTNVTSVDPGIDAETEAVFAGLVEEAPEAPADETDSAAMRFEEAQRTGVRPAPDASPDSTAHEGLDLGLDSVAAEASGDAYTMSRVAELEAELADVRAQLEEAQRARASAPPATQFSREREFLNLREVINRKEKEILDLREEVDAKDRVILGGKDKVRELDRKLRDVAEQQLALEQQLVTANETAAALRNDKEKAADREKGLKARIELAQAQLRKTDEEYEALKKRSTADHAALTAEVAARKRELEAERRAAAERAAQLEGERAAALRTAADEAAATLAARERQLEDERDAQLASLRADLGDKLERQRQDAAAQLAALRAEHGKAIAALTAGHEAALAQAAREREEALARADRAREQALEVIEQQRERELHEAEQQRLADLRAAEDRRIHELEERDEQTLRALEEAEARRKQDLEGQKRAMDEALAAAEERRAGEAAAAEAKLAELEERRAAEVAASEERRMRELFASDTRRREELAAAEARSKDEVVALEDRQTRELGALKRAHDEQTAAQAAAREKTEGELRGEIARLEGALAQARGKLAAVESDLGQSQATLRARDEQVVAQARDLADRDSRLAAHREEIERLEKENGDLQEQLLKAYQKIKSDEAIANKAKKAMAIALTLLDGEPKPLAQTPGNGEAETR
jgi:CheY-like chemotaxis protein